MAGKGAAFVAGGAKERIAKPVPGGYCQPLSELLPTVERRDGLAAAPAIVKERLVAPEVRIFGIGNRFIPFHVRSDALDTAPVQTPPWSPPPPSTPLSSTPCAA